MNNRKVIISLLVLTLLAAIYLTLAKNTVTGGENKGLISPLQSIFERVVTPQSPTPIPTPTPQTFKFDSSTDLKLELDSINPEVKEADFNDLIRFLETL